MIEYRRLDELCHINMGQSPDSKSYNEYAEGLPFFQGNADFGVIYPTARVWCSSPTKVVEPGTLLISVRAPIGALNFAKDRSCIGRGLAGITPHHGISTKFIYYALKGKYKELNAKGTGSTFKAIAKNALGETLVKVASKAEQMEIVQTLDKVSGTIEARKQQLQKLDELVKARFVEMFGNLGVNPMKWKEMPLKECLYSIDNGKSFVCANEPRQGDCPAILKLSAVTYGDFRPKENKSLLNENQFIEEAEVHSGDLLFTRKNTPELVGMATYVKNAPKKLMLPDLIFRLNTKENCSKVFLWHLINHKMFRWKIRNLASGSAKSMSNISKERLLKLNIVLPPIEFQEQFTTFVTQVDKSKEAVQQALDKTQQLFDSLMQQYFA